ncbi:hypothetical protein [Streptomyces radicis]|uniref:hypothetical protein n=1 Tax=Streptomyces radicis TaxID=1750517 RepID=UPI001600AD5F|nr:hypothetical protein [Streptomyces radicis]
MPEPINWPPGTPDHIKKPVAGPRYCDRCRTRYWADEIHTCPEPEPEPEPAAHGGDPR